MVGLLVVLLASLSAACGPETRERPRAAKEPSRATEVARVNGASIDLAQVRELATRERLPPREALAQLVKEQLLAQHAAALGYGDAPELARALERARVRALLAQAVEHGTSPSDSAVRARRLEALLGELAGKSPPRYHEDAIARALAADLP